MPTRLQLDAVKTLVAILLEKLTLPRGVVVLPVVESETVTVHVVACVIAAGDGMHPIEVDVASPLVHKSGTSLRSAPATLVLMLSFASRTPGFVGVQTTCAVQVVPPGTPKDAVEQLSEVIVKSPGLVPVMFSGCTTSGPVPVFDNVTFSAALATPTALLARERDDGEIAMLKVRGMQPGYFVAPMRVFHCHGSEVL